MTYWEKRHAQDMIEYMADAEKSAELIRAAYASTGETYVRQIRKVYETIARRFTVPLTLVRKAVAKVEDPTDFDAVLLSLRSFGLTELADALSGTSYRWRLKRIRSLQDQAAEALERIARQEIGINRELYERLLGESYTKEIFNIQKRANLGFEFAMIDPKRVTQIINRKWLGKNYSDRIWTNTQQVADRIQRDLIEMYLTGESEKAVADRIAHDLQTGYHEARRLVRTEAAYMSNVGTMEAMKECGIEDYEVVAVLDSRTSEICQRMDGKSFAVKDQKIGSNAPPFHPWCRSTVIEKLDRTVTKQLKRRARNPKTGSLERVPANMTYEKWVRSLAKAAKKPN